MGQPVVFRNQFQVSRRNYPNVKVSHTHATHQTTVYSDFRQTSMTSLYNCTLVGEAISIRTTQTSTTVLLVEQIMRHMTDVHRWWINISHYIIYHRADLDGTDNQIGKSWPSQRFRCLPFFMLSGLSVPVDYVYPKSARTYL